MNEKENNYLNKLFATSSDVSDEVEVDFPMVDVPEGLGDKLHKIADPAPAVGEVKTSFLASWPKMTSVAATLMVAVMGVQFYQQQQTLKQLEQAQADLATALHYLGEANRITREHVRNTVNQNVRAGVEPALEIGRDSVVPNLKPRDADTNEPERTRL